MIAKVLRFVLWVLAVGSIAVGAHWIWTVPQVKWKDVPFASIGTLAAACLAGLVALTVNETIDQRRLREAAEAVRAQKEALRVRREEAYTSMIEHTVRAFDRTQESGNEATVRASIAVWGSRQLLGLCLIGMRRATESWPRTEESSRRASVPRLSSWSGNSRVKPGLT